MDFECCYDSYMKFKTEKAAQKFYDAYNALPDTIFDISISGDEISGHFEGNHANRYFSNDVNQALKNSMTEDDVVNIINIGKNEYNLRTHITGDNVRIKGDYFLSIEDKYDLDDPGIQWYLKVADDHGLLQHCIGFGVISGQNLSNLEDVKNTKIIKLDDNHEVAYVTELNTLRYYGKQPIDHETNVEIQRIDAYIIDGINSPLEEYHYCYDYIDIQLNGIHEELISMVDSYSLNKSRQELEQAVNNMMKISEKTMRYQEFSSQTMDVIKEHQILLAEQSDTHKVGDTDTCLTLEQWMQYYKEKEDSSHTVYEINQEKVNQFIESGQLFTCFNNGQLVYVKFKEDDSVKRFREEFILPDTYIYGAGKEVFVYELESKRNGLMKKVIPLLLKNYECLEYIGNTKQTYDKWLDCSKKNKIIYKLLARFLTELLTNELYIGQLQRCTSFYESKLMIQRYRPENLFNLMNFYFETDENNLYLKKAIKTSMINIIPGQYFGKNVKLRISNQTIFGKQSYLFFVESNHQKVSFDLDSESDSYLEYTLVEKVDFIDVSGLHYNISPLPAFGQSEISNIRGSLTLSDASKQWKISTDSRGLFNDVWELESIDDMETWDIFNVTDMSGLFSGCDFLSDISSLSQWDVSNVTNMNGLFSGCESLSDISSLSQWDVSNVTNMSGLFSGCDFLSDISSLSQWDVSNVTNMSGLFSRCGFLSDISSLSQWDVSNVTDMREMLKDCDSLSDISALSQWDVSNVTDMREMLKDCDSLSDISALSQWDVSNVTNISGLFSWCKSLSDISALSQWDVSNVTNISGLFSWCKSLSDVSSLSQWDVSNVTNISSLFSWCKSLSDISALSQWDVSNVTNMSGLFSWCKSLSDISALSQWDVSNVTDMNGLFSGCDFLRDASALSQWDVSSVTYMGAMFKNCDSLSDISALSQWDVSSVINMCGLFSGCKSLNDISALSQWNISNVGNMSELFSGCKSLSDVSSLSQWDVSNVAGMSGLFSGCDFLSDISSLSQWDVSNVRSMSELFSGCKLLSDISSLLQWDVSSVTYMDAMFKDCKSLSDISALSQWDVSSVTYMREMFKDCKSLSDISALSQWNFNEVVIV